MVKVKGTVMGYRNFCQPKLATGSRRNRQTQAWRIEDASCLYTVDK
jgi:hypothetical protein